MRRPWTVLRAAAPIAALTCWGVATFVSAAQPPEWTQPVQPFRIAPSIYYVGTKGLAAYLITSQDGAILLDGTLQENASLIERNIQAVGVPLDKVKLIVSDHAHSDHVGAIAQIKRDTGHPEIAGVFERQARVKVGDRDAFIDPSALSGIVAKAKADFESALAKAQRTKQPNFSP
jgi:glyoxylase-like metal-dependent hydrolase (beta-lactamase superfamily II)